MDKVIREIDPSLVPDKLPDMTMSVREDFTSNRIVVTVGYSRYACTVVDMDLIPKDEAKVIDALACAAHNATKLLRADIETAVGVPELRRELADLRAATVDP